MLLRPLVHPVNALPDFEVRQEAADALGDVGILHGLGSIEYLHINCICLRAFPLPLREVREGLIV